MRFNQACHLATIAGDTLLVPCHVGQSGYSFENQAPSSTGTQSSKEFHRLDLKTGHQDNIPSNGHKVHIPYFISMD